MKQPAMIANVPLIRTAGSLYEKNTPKNEIKMKGASILDLKLSYDLFSFLNLINENGMASQKK